ncbi:MAG: hypothetical protein Q7S33_00400 [Nanoarchaeota archaeon]|nr:hypothetical protein [Nanoarchaeota archaeon]
MENLYEERKATLYLSKNGRCFYNGDPCMTPNIDCGNCTNMDRFNSLIKKITEEKNKKRIYNI